MAEYPSITKHPLLDEWIAIDPEGRVTVRTGKVDIGQRISNAVALIVAEELDVDFEKIDVARAETGVAPNEGVTAGSNSMQESGEAVRVAAATARAYLLKQAAEALDVDIASLDVSDGLIQSRETNHTITYADLTGGKAFDIPVDQDIAVKAPEDYKNTGIRRTPKGLADLVTGTAKFVHDIVLPNMLHARLVRPPHYQARLKGLDDGVMKRLDETGTQLVRDGSFLAVVNEDEYGAIKAIERVNKAADWDMGDGVSTQELFEALRSNDRESLPVYDGTPREEPVPPLADPPDSAIVTLTAEFNRPYHMHGSIGPSASVALFEDGTLTVWSHSQGIYPLRGAMAEVLNMAVEDIRVIHTPGAGCYGHNGADDVSLDAALVARAIPGRPILLKWTREDEHAWEPYSSCMAMNLQASLDGESKVVAWSHETYSDTHNMRPVPGREGSAGAKLLAARFLADPLIPPTPVPSLMNHMGIHRNLDPLYTFADKRLVKNLVSGLPLRTSALRTLGAYANVFAIESFIDELAEAGGIDPIEFRLRNLDDERAKAVIRAVDDRMGRGSLPEGVGRGIAFGQYKNAKTYAAVAIELEVDDAAEVKLRRVVIAADAGQVVDPEGLTAQLEGGMLQAASWTLYEGVTFDKDGITSRDWETYPILRFDNIPDVETILMERPGEKFLGAGEATSGPTAGAIANAIYNATGLRPRSLPFTPDAIRAVALA